MNGWIVYWLVGLTVIAILDGLIADYRYRHLERRIEKLEEER